MRPTAAHRSGRSSASRPIGRSTVPSLLLRCRDDPIAPQSVGDWMAARMHGSWPQPMAVIGHCPHVGAPVQMAEAIRSALR